MMSEAAAGRLGRRKEAEATPSGDGRRCRRYGGGDEQGANREERTAGDGMPLEFGGRNNSENGWTWLRPELGLNLSSNKVGDGQVWPSKRKWPESA
jgi:hypothetical protein